MSIDGFRRSIAVKCHAGRFSVWVWAGRQLWQHPLMTGCQFAAVAVVALVLAAQILTADGVDRGLRPLLAAGPDLVVRRIGPDGWRPMPAAAALASARSVAGVMAAHPRLWGVVSGPAGPLTVMALLDGRPPSLLSDPTLPTPGAGQAVVGPAVPVPDSGRLRLSAGRALLELAVVSRFADSTRLATADLVLASAEDVRKLLTLGPEQVSDLAVSVYHPEEARRLMPDLADAFPWPVHITRRQAVLEQHDILCARRNTARALALLPAVLAIAFIAVAVGIHGYGRRAECGLLKALGWTAGDLMRLHLYRTLIISVPAVIVGFGAAWMAVFGPWGRVMIRWLYQWPGQAPQPVVDPAGAGATLLMLGALILMPVVGAAFWAALRAGQAHPQELGVFQPWQVLK